MGRVVTRRRSSRTPAFITGTSSEFLGRRPWPRVLLERHIGVILGPSGAGKTSVALRLAGQPAQHVGTRALQEALLDRVRLGAWPQVYRECSALVLDGPVFLRGRDGVVDLLREMVQYRARFKRRTILCQDDSDGSLEELIAVLRPGSVTVIGLRFPTGKRGRVRFARRVCEELGAPTEAARGTETMVPWRYERVVEVIRRWPSPVSWRDGVASEWGTSH